MQAPCTITDIMHITSPIGLIDKRSSVCIHVSRCPVWQVQSRVDHVSGGGVCVTADRYSRFELVASEVMVQTYTDVAVCSCCRD